MSTDKRSTSRIIDNRFVIGELIGKGSFGKVYDAHDKIIGRRCAIKFERRDDIQTNLKNEYEVYKAIGPIDGVPGVICFGSEKHYDYLALEILGPTLEKLFEHCKRKFSLKTVLMIGYQMLKRIEKFHQMSHLHRDIKPDNFAVDSQNYNKIHIIDFGLARRYSQLVNGRVEHIRMQQGKVFTGTVRYASINTQKCMTTSRRDDLESLAYVLIYFMKGSLPWQQIPKPSTAGITSKQRKEMILELKMSLSIAELCRDLPFGFNRFLKCCRETKFDEQPRYSYLRLLLEDMCRTRAYELDYKFDWNLMHECKRVESKTESNSTIM